MNMNMRIRPLTLFLSSVLGLSLAAAAGARLIVMTDFTEDMINAYYNKMNFFNNGWTYTYPAFSDPKVTSVENEYKASLVELFKVDYVKLITCDPAEFDALYAQLCEEYNAAGFAEIVDARLEAYENGMSTKLPETVINAKTSIG